MKTITQKCYIAVICMCLLICPNLVYASSIESSPGYVAYNLTGNNIAGVTSYEGMFTYQQVMLAAKNYITLNLSEIPSTDVNIQFTLVYDPVYYQTYIPAIQQNNNFVSIDSFPNYHKGNDQSIIIPYADIQTSNGTYIKYLSYYQNTYSVTIPHNYLQNEMRIYVGAQNNEYVQRETGLWRIDFQVINFYLSYSDDGSGAAEQESKIDELASEQESLIDVMNSVTKPATNSTDLNADSYVDSGALQAASNTLGIFFNNPIIMAMCLIVASMAVGSFFLFGKK